MLNLILDKPVRLLYASPGHDSQVSSITELVDPHENFSPKSPWYELGISSVPVLTLRGHLFTLIFEPLKGSWSSLEDCNGGLFSLAIMQADTGQLAATLAPAALDYLSLLPIGNSFNGRVDIKLLGAPRRISNA
jgi:hypothetical protein